MAAPLAARLRAADWVAGASVTGGGYLTVTVTPKALAALAVRVPAAGADCAASNALRGHICAAPPAADVVSAADWEQAWGLVASAVTAQLAAAAGAQIIKAKTMAERLAPPNPETPATVEGEKGRPLASPAPLDDAQTAPAVAVAAAGADTVRYALARTSAHRARLISPMRYVPNNLDNPFFAVRYAHARAASVLRWAGDLGIDRGEPGAFRPELLAEPSEHELLGAISWLPERVASAARRRRPDAFVRYLEWLASSWLNCSENCPALPFGGHSAPGEQEGIAARLWLAAAAATALGTCLRLAGVAAPRRL